MSCQSYSYLIMKSNLRPASFPPESLNHIVHNRDTGPRGPIGEGHGLFILPGDALFLLISLPPPGRPNGLSWPTRYGKSSVFQRQKHWEEAAGSIARSRDTPIHVRHSVRGAAGNALARPGTLDPVAVVIIMAREKAGVVRGRDCQSLPARKGPGPGGAVLEQKRASADGTLAEDIKGPGVRYRGWPTRGRLRSTKYHPARVPSRGDDLCEWDGGSKGKGVHMPGVRFHNVVQAVCSTETTGPSRHRPLPRSRQKKKKKKTVAVTPRQGAAPFPRWRAVPVQPLLEYDGLGPRPPRQMAGDHYLGRDGENVHHG